MAEIVLTPEAEEDLKRIYEYTYVNWGEQQANEYQDDLFQGMLILLDNREIGVEYKHTPGGYRIFKVKKHLVFYRNEQEKVIVVRILHERMNPVDTF